MKSIKLLISIFVIALSLTSCKKAQKIKNSELGKDKNELAETKLKIMDPPDGQIAFVIGKVKRLRKYPANGSSKEEILDLGGAFPCVEGCGWMNFPFDPSELKVANVQRNGGGVDPYGNPAIENIYTVLEINYKLIDQNDLIYGDYVFGPKGEIIRYEPKN